MEGKCKAVLIGTRWSKIVEKAVGGPKNVV